MVGRMVDSKKEIRSHKTRNYIIDGDPVAWSRPGKNGFRSYDTQKALKLARGIQLQEQYDGEQFKGPLRLEVCFYFSPPPSKRPADRNSLIGRPHVYRPDLDNLVKFLKDLSVDCGLLKDDCIIHSVIAKKSYDIRARTEFTFIEE
jgi:Holliday junction resolvase RusA-like endonuclease